MKFSALNLFAILMVNVLLSAMNVSRPAVAQPENSGARQLDRQSKQSGIQSSALLQIAGPIRIQVVPGTDILIVTGRDREEVQLVEALIRQLMQSADTGGPIRKRIRLENANAKYVAVWAQHLYDRNFSARHGAVTITALRQSDILMLGPPSAVAQAEKIVLEMDQ